jgi:phosphohistidine phosphatase SixA
MPGAEATSYLVRHAKAGSRERWTEPDQNRPLTEAGRAQAAALIELLGRDVTIVQSSPFVRCMETVAPLAAALGLQVDAEARLAEGAGPEWTLSRLASAPGSVLCTHGDVMAAVVEALASTHIPMKGGMQCAKAGTWAFEVVSGRIVAGRYLPPPG